jgi:hypothetical protein
MKPKVVTFDQLSGEAQKRIYSILVEKIDKIYSDSVKKKAATETPITFGHRLEQERRGLHQKTDSFRGRV